MSRRRHGPIGEWSKFRNQVPSAVIKFFLGSIKYFMYTENLFPSPMIFRLMYLKDIEKGEKKEKSSPCPLEPPAIGDSEKG